MSYFGDLVKALREAQQDTNLRKWTRPQTVQELVRVQQSAEDYSVKVIENIESGHTRPTAGMLSDLAKVFRMTRLEVKEFFSAALSPAPEVTSETKTADSAIFAQQRSLLKDIRLPGFLTDYYGDIIAANRMVLNLFSIPKKLVDRLVEPPESGQVEPGINLMEFVFDERTFRFKSIIGKELWEEYAHVGIYLFRAFTLRHRADPYFKERLRQLRRFPQFDEYWQKAYWEERPHYTTNFRFKFKYTHPRHGNVLSLDYYSTSSAVMVTEGALNLTFYLPANEDTEAVFRGSLTGLEGGMFANNDVKFVASWPEKPDLHGRKLSRSY